MVKVTFFETDFVPQCHPFLTTFTKQSAVKDPLNIMALVRFANIPIPCPARVFESNQQTTSCDLLHFVRDGICVYPPLCRGTSQDKYSSCTKGLVCVGEVVGKLDEVGERELVLVFSVRCGKE